MWKNKENRKNLRLKKISTKNAQPKVAKKSGVKVKKNPNKPSFTSRLASQVRGVKVVYSIGGLNLDNFINLLKNALETKATHICVTAKLSNDERWAIFTIEDNGGGFENDISDNLFTPFFTTKSEGQGIGLAVCRQIVSNHGGLIGAENAEAGARFTVRLPM